MMGQGRDNNVYTRVKRKLVTGGTGRAKRQRQPYSKAAHDALGARIVELFEGGLNTVEIAAKVNAKESKVYNMLARLT